VYVQLIILITLGANILECKGQQMTTENGFKVKSDDQDLHMA
jgi:hypothetical protein